VHVVLVYLKPFRRNSLLNGALQPKIAKKFFHQNPSFGGLRSFKDKSKKPVTSACYDMQQVYTYLQLFLHYKHYKSTAAK